MTNMQTCHGKANPLARRDLTDDELIERVRAGNQSHFGVLIDRYHRRLFCVALRILKNDAEAEDALQDAYVLALTRLDQFAGRSSFFTWMARITMNEAFTRIRCRQRVQRLAAAMESPANLHRLFAPVETPEQGVIRRELDSVLQSGVRTLPEHYRTVFAMRDLDELSTFETARSLGVSEECIKTRLHRARELLKRRLSKRVRPWRKRRLRRRRRSGARPRGYPAAAMRRTWAARWRSPGSTSPIAIGWLSGRPIPK